MKFIKKPLEIEAIKLCWDNWSEICEFAKVGYLTDGSPEGTYLDDNNKPLIISESSYFGDKSCSFKLGLLIPTLEGLMIAKENDWIIKGIKGELYPCKPDIFEETYEKIDDPNS
jgi:hypothetical protein